MTCWLVACSSSENRHFEDGAPSPDLGSSPADRSDVGAPVSAIDGARPASTLRFDGLYQHPDQGYSGFLRFYEDQTVLAASSTGTPQQVAAWLRKDNGTNSTGQFVLEGTSISFVATNYMGSVEYQGEVGEDQLVLQMHSLINDYRSTDTYTFVPVALQ